jgi:hypothetical protein
MVYTSILVPDLSDWVKKCCKVGDGINDVLILKKIWLTPPDTTPFKSNNLRNNWLIDIFIANYGAV